MSADIETVENVREFRAAKQRFSERRGSILVSNGTVTIDETMGRQLNNSCKHENRRESPMSENELTVNGAQIAAKKSNRKRKSYYLNEVVHLGADPIASEFNVTETERENISENVRVQENGKTRKSKLVSNNHKNGCELSVNEDKRCEIRTRQSSKNSLSSQSVKSTRSSPDVSTNTLKLRHSDTDSNGSENGSLDNSKNHVSSDNTESSISNENGSVKESDQSAGVNIAIVSEQETVKTSRTRPNPFKLIRCEKYGVETQAPFQLYVSVEAITIIDVHAHCVQNEVIGLLGGKYCPVLCQLHIHTAVPCESITSSTTDLQCEMDPVSQAMASEKLAREGYNVVGWYHSHPTFLPNPSLRDLETQEKYQQLFAEGKQPFVALILSPYSSSMQPSQKNSYVSKYKCLMVSDQQNSQGDYRIPYEFSPQLIRREKLVYNVLSSIRELCPKIAGLDSTLCLSEKIKGREIQYIQKLTASLKHHLEVTGLSNKESDQFLECLKDVLMTNVENGEN
ncbi:histone H2A deubiquitinase MYSM1-like protein [Leptotrombidium deliense]|uniref:Histone H2A deubiquitinase MYSM1-like protein n=1 Tax=Leptotrombidium deliense TaxID=299467 RepID=A0A443SS74_9ACAR|nr:histone H2A deubiquitinase MYSM1-like protein [Leptotrombidium deliense]